MGFAEGLNAGSGAVTRGLEISQRAAELELAKQRELRESAESTQRQALAAQQITKGERVNAAQAELDDAQKGGIAVYGSARGAGATQQAQGDATREANRMGLQPPAQAPVTREAMRPSDLAGMRARVAGAQGDMNAAQALSDRQHQLQYNEAKKDAADEFDKDPQKAWASVAERAGQLNSMGIPIAVPTEYPKGSAMEKEGLKAISVTDPKTGKVNHLELNPQQQRELFSAFTAGSSVDPTLAAQDISAVDDRLGHWAAAANAANTGAVQTQNQGASATGALLRGDAAEKRSEAYMAHMQASEGNQNRRYDAMELASYRTPPQVFKDAKGNAVVMERIASRNPDGSIKLSWQKAEGMPDGLTPMAKGASANMEPDKWASGKGDYESKLLGQGVPPAQAAMRADAIFGKFHGDPNAQINGATPSPASNAGVDLQAADKAAAAPKAPASAGGLNAPAALTAQQRAAQIRQQLDNDQKSRAGNGGYLDSFMNYGLPLGIAQRSDLQNQYQTLTGQPYQTQPGQ